MEEGRKGKGMQIKRAIPACAELVFLSDCRRMVDGIKAVGRYSPALLLLAATPPKPGTAHSSMGLFTNVTVLG